MFPSCTWVALVVDDFANCTTTQTISSLTSVPAENDNGWFHYLTSSGAVTVASTANPVAPRIKAGVAPLRAGSGTSFFLRRLHSLSGVVPIGAFLLEHFISNAEAFKGPLAYGKQVEFLNSLPGVFLMELFFIWIPILYHGLYGIYIWYRGETNVVDYPWTGNWLFTAQ